MSKIVLCGGGTAGHIMPNIALLPTLKQNFDEIHYIGTDGLEKKLLANYPYVKYHEISSVKLVRSLTLKNLAIPFKLAKSIKQCKKILKEISPNVIFSKGGYVSVPVVLASKNIPVYAHESDYTMGLANKIIYKKANTMFFSFDDTAKKYKKGKLSGPPIRAEIFSGNKNKAKSELKINNNLPCVLFVGGSLGAKAINEIVYKCVPKLCKSNNVIHITGKNYTTLKHQNYFQIEYSTHIEDLLALADYVVSRSGSNAIFEFLTLKKPMLLIPLPKSNSRGDQILNANYFHKNGFAHVLYQEDLTEQNLINEINYLKQTSSELKHNMNRYTFSNGTDIILKELLRYSK